MLRTCLFSRFNDEKIKAQYYNKGIRTRENGNVQSHDQEESRLNSAISGNSGAHTLTHYKIRSIQ